MFRLLPKTPEKVDYRILHMHVLKMIEFTEKEAMMSVCATGRLAPKLLDLYKLENKYSKMRTYHD